MKKGDIPRFSSQFLLVDTLQETGDVPFFEER